MFDFLPPSLIQIGPIPLHFYGLAYAFGLAGVYLVMTREASRRRRDADLIPNGLIIVAIAALIGGRLYHVIDQIAYYKDHPLQAILPIDAAGNFIGFGGLGVYGGIITGAIAAIVYMRRRRVSAWAWADIVAPGLFTMQAIARWGNYFNQELYGPPTDVPWGIPIDCAHRIPQYACPVGSDPASTLGQHFVPLFLYESISGFLGLIVLLVLARRLAGRLRTGDLLAIFFIWYGAVRFGLETLRADNWTFFGIPMAQIFSTIFILAGLGIIVLRRVSGAPTLRAADDAAATAALAAAAAGEAGSPALDEAGPGAGAGEELPVGPGTAAAIGSTTPGSAPPGT